MHKSKVEHFVLVNQGIVVNAYENKAEVVRLERVTSGLIWQKSLLHSHLDPFPVLRIVQISI